MKNISLYYDLTCSIFEKNLVRASENANEISGHHYMCFQAFTPDKCATGFEILAMTDLIMEDTIGGTSAM